MATTIKYPARVCVCVEYTVVNCLETGQTHKCANLFQLPCILHALGKLDHPCPYPPPPLTPPSLTVHPCRNCPSFLLLFLL